MSDVEANQPAGPAGDPASRRMPQLDLLRAVAICMVLLCHNDDLLRSAGRLEGFASFANRFGWTGVDLFFVLSGFLIGGILFREIQVQGQLHVGQFLVRRAFKIWPGYLALIGYAAFRNIHHGSTLMRQVRMYWPNLLHVQNYTANNIRLPTWSLAVEEHFYLLLPLLLAWLVRSGGARRVERMFLPIACCAIGLIALNRTIEGLLVVPSLVADYFPTHLRIDALLFGVCMAHVATFRPAVWSRLMGRPATLAVVGLLMLVPPMFLDRERSLFMHTAGYTMLYAGFGCLLIAVLSVRPGEGLIGRGLTSPVGRVVTLVGVYSYSIYLWHYDLGIEMVAYHLRGLIDRLPTTLGWIEAVLIYVLMAVGAGMVMNHTIERPMLRLRDRLVPARRTGDSRASADDRSAAMSVASTSAAA